MQWIASNLGQFFATIGGDNKFKLWREDPSQMAKSGRRFRCIYSQSPPNHVSYVSFGSKTIKHEVYLSLITHDGLLNLLEPSDPESLGSWNQADSIYPFGQHPRGTEARFRLSIHQSESPSSNAAFAGADSQAISLAVSAINLIKIYRAIKPSEPSEGNHQFYEMVEMCTENAIINEIAWAPGCLHPYNIVAAACDDGSVRMYRIDVFPDVDNPFRALNEFSQSNGKGSHIFVDNAPSGIGAGLAGMSRRKGPRTEVPNSLNTSYVWEEFAVLPHDDGSPVWKVRWLHDGKPYWYVAQIGIRD